MEQSTETNGASGDAESNVKARAEARAQHEREASADCDCGLCQLQRALKAKLRELAEETDEQRSERVQNAIAKQYAEEIASIPIILSILPQESSEALRVLDYCKRVVRDGVERTRSGNPVVIPLNGSLHKAVADALSSLNGQKS